MALAITLASAQTSTQTPTPTHYDNSWFSADYPSGPVVETSEAIPFKDGTTGTMYEYSVETDGGKTAYLVMINNYRPDQAQNSADNVLASTKAGALKSCTDRSNYSESKSSIGGVYANAFQFKCNDEKDHFFFYVRQGVKWFGDHYRLYQVIYVNGSDQDPSKGVTFTYSVIVK